MMRYPKKPLILASACIGVLATDLAGRAREAANPDASARKAYRPDTPLKNTEHPGYKKYQAMLDEYMARPDRYTERWRPQFHFWRRRTDRRPPAPAARCRRRGRGG